MNKRIVAFSALFIALIGVVAYLWLNGRETDVVSSDPVDEAPAAETSTALPAVSTEPLPTLAPDAEQPAASTTEVATQKYAAVEDAVGYRGELRSVDYDIYLVFMVLGDASEIIDAAGTLKDKAWINSVQLEYELTDEELQKLLVYSRTSLEADRKYQTALQDEICAKRGSFNSLHEFGNAINDFSRNAIENQERMGRQAESELGPVLFSKISSRVRSKPREMAAGVDFASMLTARNEGLDVEIERACPSGK